LTQPATHSRFSSLSIREELRRTAEAEIDASLEALTTANDPVEVVHECRKAIKRVRALVSLGTCIDGGDARRLDRMLRDTGRLMGPIRDATVFHQTLEKLTPEPSIIEGTDVHAEDNAYKRPYVSAETAGAG
jgi:CHAD domain-containing protein